MLNFRVKFSYKPRNILSGFHNRMVFVAGYKVIVLKYRNVVITIE